MPPLSGLRNYPGLLKELKIDNDTAMELINLLELDGHVYYEEFVDALGSLHADVKPTDLLVLRVCHDFPATNMATLNNNFCCGFV
eukprot:5306375-Amphidinium_carterae.1